MSCVRIPMSPVSSVLLPAPGSLYQRAGALPSSFATAEGEPGVSPGVALGQGLTGSGVGGSLPPASTGLPSLTSLVSPSPYGVPGNTC